MKRILLLLLLLGSFGIASAADSALFRANSKELGYNAIDLDVKEISRTERTSTLTIRGFHTRTAFGSRWLMCSYTALAMQRGFTLWAAYYPLPSEDNLLLFFPTSESDELTSLAGQQLDKVRLIRSPAHSQMLAFCSQVLAK